jgi:hypothetical protein
MVYTHTHTHTHTHTRARAHTHTHIETGSHCVAQVGLQRLGLSNPPASVAMTTGVYHLVLKGGNFNFCFRNLCIFVHLGASYHF